MIYIPCGIIGILWGAFLAFKRKGNMADIAQYAAGFGIAFALLGFLATIILHRTGMLAQWGLI